MGWLAFQLVRKLSKDAIPAVDNWIKKSFIDAPASDLPIMTYTDVLASSHCSGSQRINLLESAYTLLLHLSVAQKTNSESSKALARVVSFLGGLFNSETAGLIN